MTPHAGLMDPDSLGPEAAALQRARLHIRGGRRRLRQGKKAAGLITLYDALTSAVDWFLESPERRAEVGVETGKGLGNDAARYAVLVRSGVLDAGFDMDAFETLVDRALAGDPGSWNEAETVTALERVMSQLGVMPFDEEDLPPEDPRTF